MVEINEPGHRGHDWFLRVAAVAKQMNLPDEWIRMIVNDSADVTWVGDDFRLAMSHFQRPMTAEWDTPTGTAFQPDPNYNEGYKQGYFNQTMREAGIPEEVLSRSQIEKATAKINKALAIIVKGLGLQPTETRLYVPSAKHWDHTKPSILIGFQTEVDEVGCSLGYCRTNSVVLCWQLPGKKPAA